MDSDDEDVRLLSPQNITAAVTEDNSDVEEDGTVPIQPLQIETNTSSNVMDVLNGNSNSATHRDGQIPSRTASMTPNQSNPQYMPLAVPKLGTFRSTTSKAIDDYLKSPMNVGNSVAPSQLSESHSPTIDLRDLQHLDDLLNGYQIYKNGHRIDNAERNTHLAWVDHCLYYIHQKWSKENLPIYQLTIDPNEIRKYIHKMYAETSEDGMNCEWSKKDLEEYIEFLNECESVYGQWVYNDLIHLAMKVRELKMKSKQSMIDVPVTFLLCIRQARGLETLWSLCTAT